MCKWVAPERQICEQNSKFWQLWELYSHISAPINVKFCPLPCAKCHVHRNNVYRLYGAENPFWTTEYIKCNTGRHTAPRAFMPVISNFGDFSACKPTFLKPQPWTLAWGYGPVTPSPASSIVKVSQGNLSPRGNFFTKYWKFLRFWAFMPTFL